MKAFLCRVLCSAPEVLHAPSNSDVCFSKPCGVPALRPCWPLKPNALGILPPNAFEAQRAAVHEVAKNQTWLSNWQVYVGTFLCSLVGLIFFGAKGVFGPPSVSSVYADTYLLDRKWFGEQNLYWILSRASPLLCSYFCLIRGGVYPFLIC